MKEGPDEFRDKFHELLFFGLEKISSFPKRRDMPFPLVNLKYGPKPQPLTDPAYRKDIHDGLVSGDPARRYSVGAGFYLVDRGFPLEDKFNPLLDKCLPFNMIDPQCLPDLVTSWGQELRDNVSRALDTRKPLNEELVVLIVNLSIKTFLTPFRSMSTELIGRMRDAIKRHHSLDLAEQYSATVFPGTTYLEQSDHNQGFMVHVTPRMLLARN
jgi:hypothetical protein